jgi:hypothetical protein
MSAPRKFFATLGNAVDVFGSAIAVSSAVQNRSRVNPQHLRNLGIDEVAFRNIGRS